MAEENLQLEQNEAKRDSMSQAWAAIGEIERGAIRDLLTRDGVAVNIECGTAGLDPKKNSQNEWPLTKIKNPVYRKLCFWICTIETIEEDLNLSFKGNIPIIFKNLQSEIKNISSFIRKVKNLKEKVEKKKNYGLLTDDVIPPLSANIEIGVECGRFGITKSWLENPSPMKVSVTNKMVLELRYYRNTCNIPYKKCEEWMKCLVGGENHHLGSLRLCWDRVYKRKKSLDFDRVKQNEYVNKLYILKSSHIISDQPLSQTTNCDGIPSSTSTAPPPQITPESNEICDIRKEKREISLKLHEACKKNTCLGKKIKKCEEKLSVLSTRNVNKRIRRRDSKIDQLTKKYAECRRKVQITQERINKQKQRYKRQNVLLRHYKIRRMSQKKNANVEHGNADTCKPATYNTATYNTATYNTSQVQTLSEVNETISFLENENEFLKEKILELTKENTDTGKAIKTFHGGKYVNEIRDVYASLLSMNVGVKNVETVVRTVISKLTDVCVDRLPKKTFAEMMLVEAKAMAQIQAVEGILSSDNCTLHTDGTKRAGKEYGGLQIGTTSGQYSVGLSEIVSGTSASFFDMIKNIIEDISKLVVTDNIEGKSAEIVSKINNMMTDRHVVNTSLKGHLEKWKSDCLPLIMENFNTLPDNIKKKYIEINDFKCNLHVLVNLGSQAETALRQWEKSVLLSDSPSDLSYFSTSDFIRATSKLCVPGADEKSGYGLLFKTYLQNLETPKDLKITSFHGHRINAIFSMAATVFYHRKDIEQFIDVYFDDKQNKLVSAVGAYLANDVVVAGCRALGIIDKLLTGPIWRQIESAKHILDLNDMWASVLSYFEAFSKDSSNLLLGEPVYPNFTVKDSVYDSLFSVNDETLNVLTIEILQILCTNFLIIIHRQLGDNLPGGKFHCDTTPDFPSLKQNSSSVSATNIVSERDFANLDRLQREKPNANTIALEGMILFTNNKTLKWLDNMEKEKKDIVFDMARKSAPKMLVEFQKRKSEIKLKHAELLKQKEEAVLNTERRKINEILKLNRDIQQWGGLWETTDSMTTNINNIVSSSKVDAVKCQLKYRKTVLKNVPSDKSLFQFSSEGKIFTISELISNLQCIINECGASNRLPTEVQTVNVFEIRSKEERDNFMKSHRLIILKKVEDIKQKQLKRLQNCNIPVSNDSNVCDKEQTQTKKRRRRTENKLTPKKAKRVCDDEISDLSGSDAESDQISIPPQTDPSVFKFKLNQMVAVAYSDCFYPGQVIKLCDDNRAVVKFLHPCSSALSSFRWPNRLDESEIENIFVFFSNFDIVPKDSSGRTWSIPNIQSIQARYLDYKREYF